MKVEDLWIGDWLQIIDSGIIGRYEGLNDDGKLIINVDKQKYFTGIDNVRISDTPKINDKKKESLPPLSTSSPHEVQTTIDLHLEKLAPNMKFSTPARILQYQVTACQKFIRQAIDNKLKVVKIIHGKGEGILKAEILYLLGKYPEIKFSIPIHNEGGLEVWFND